VQALVPATLKTELTHYYLQLRSSTPSVLGNSLTGLVLSEGAVGWLLEPFVSEDGLLRGKCKCSVIMGSVVTVCDSNVLISSGGGGKTTKPESI